MKIKFIQKFLDILSRKEKFISLKEQYKSELYELYLSINSKEKHIMPNLTDFSGTIIPLKPFPDTLDKRWKKIGPNTINGFVKALHDFAVKSNFARIYMINRSDYLSNVNWLGDSLEKKNVEPWARKFFKGIYVGDTTFVTSRVTVCYNFYDTVQDFYGWKYSYITTYPGVSATSHITACRTHTRLYSIYLEKSTFF